MENAEEQNDEGNTKKEENARGRTKKKRADKFTKKRSNGAQTDFGIQDELNLKAMASGGSHVTTECSTMEDINRRLQQQLQEVVERNSKLSKQVEDQKNRIKTLTRQWEEQKEAVGGAYGDAAANKILELAKKVRHSTADLEAERTRNRTLEKKLREICRMKEAAESKAKSTSPRRQQVDEMQQLREKLQQAMSRLLEFRGQNQKLKQELQTANKVISLEVGKPCRPAALLKQPGSWKGRAQQILALQSRLVELQSQLTQQRTSSDTAVAEQGRPSPLVRSTTSLSTPAQNTVSNTSTATADSRTIAQLRAMEKTRHESYQAAVAQVNALVAGRQELQEKLEAVRSRSTSLGSQVRRYRQQVAELLEKKKNDDQIIDALTRHNNVTETSMQTNEQQLKEMEMKHRATTSELRQKIQHQSDVISGLKTALEDREAKVRSLEESISGKEDKSSAAINAKTSQNKVATDDGCADTGESTELRRQLVEQQYLCQVTSEERDTLGLHVQNLSTRLAESESRRQALEAELSQQKNRAVQLEHRSAGLSRLLGRTKSSSRKLSEGAEEELLSRINILREEKEKLEQELEKTRQYRGDDLKSFQETVQKAKDIFVNVLSTASLPQDRRHEIPN